MNHEIVDHDAQLQARDSELTRSSDKERQAKKVILEHGIYRESRFSSRRHIYAMRASRDGNTLGLELLETCTAQDTPHADNDRSRKERHAT